MTDQESAADVSTRQDLSARGVHGDTVMRVVHASVTIVDGRKITDLELAQMPLVGRRVRFDPDSVTRLRKVLLWSRAEMAAELGVAPLTVSRWERGQSTPQAKNLGDLVDLAFRHQVAFEPWCNPSR